MNTLKLQEELEVKSHVQIDTPEQSIQLDPCNREVKGISVAEEVH